MKIIAIRGKNLASLAGEFEIQFNQEPLASTGLFAICGPTGSGKSTLLDALCLALYGNTPRLTDLAVKGVSLPDVGDETITAQDPRNLLRRGAGEGLAEVDFVGNDGVSYRARWSVRRARGKAGGKLQGAEMGLKTLDGSQIIGGVKTEVQEAIKERLGLSFGQFTRAVLLAQNEFAAFLQADSNERGQLLQTLTGLDACTGISIRAFDRAKAEQQMLKALTDQLAGQQPLAAEDRVQREQERDAAKAEAVKLEQRKIELDRQLQWHETWEKLKQDEQQALATVQKTCADQDATSPRRAYLTQVEAVQEARSYMAEIDRMAEEIAKNRQAVGGAEEKLDEAQHLRQQTNEALAKANQAVAAAEHAKADASADLDCAKLLDADIIRLNSEYKKANTALDDARKAEAKAQENLSSKKTECDLIAQQLQTTQNWLAAHQPLRVLAEDWPRWDMLLGEAAKAQNNLREAEEKVIAGQQDEQNKRQAFDTASGDWDKAKKAFQTAKTQLDTTIQALSKFNAETLAEHRKIAANHLDQLKLVALNDEASALQEKITQAKTVLNQLLADKPTAAIKLEQARKSLETAKAACAENVETLRETLETGSPCPVCGAMEHPYATGDAPSRAILISLRNEVNSCQNALNELGTQEAENKKELENTQQRLTRIAEERELLTLAIQPDGDTWNTHPAATELATVKSADRPAWFADQQRMTRDQLTAIAQEEEALRQAAKVRDEAQQIRDQAQQQYSVAQDQLNNAQAALKEAAQTLKTAQERLAEINRQLQDRLDALDAAFSGYDWRPRWQTDPIAFHEERQQKVEKWKDYSQKTEQSQNQISVFDSEIRTLTETVAEKAVQRQHASEEFQLIDYDLQTKCRQRKNLFNGQPVAEMEAIFAKSIEDAKIVLHDQEGKEKTAANNEASAKAVLGHTKQALLSSQENAKQADAAFNNWIADFNTRNASATLDSTQLHALLAHDNDWLKRERGELQKLRDDVQKAETTLDERQSKREGHERQGATLDSAEMVKVAKQQTLADLNTANRRHNEAELDLRRDDERRAETAKLQEDIARQTAKTEVWGKLNELIGSAKGEKFRNYAQQFTLEVLLRYANHHLTGLSRRYRLERVKDSLALMVVDQDMGDELRSVHSLSGGESFLVSLALALGLASLSSNRVRVESLFIDEGFGSLDADTLRVAMDALDNLQAQGRKVGVISHVQEMSERIGIQIRVQRQSGGQSRVEVRSG